MEDPNLNVILLHIQHQDYKNALDLINATNGHKTITNLLRTLCLTELENFVEAEKAVKQIEDLSKYFNSIIYKNLNMMDKLRKYISSDRELYEYYVLQGNYDEANTYAKNMSNNYKIFSAVMSWKREIYDYLQQTAINSNMLIFLHRQGVCNINSYITKINKPDAHFYVLIKEVFTSQTMHQGIANEVMENDGKNYTGDESFLNYLISKIDDWALYEMALKRNFYLPKTTSSNYKYYKMAKEKNLEAIKEHIYTLTDFEKILELKEKYFIVDFESTTHNILNRHLQGTESNDDIKNMYAIFTKNPTFLNTKIFISMLLSTQKESNIMYAYYIVKKMKTIHPDQYEIKLLHLFLARFFCDYEEVKRSLEFLGVKNVLHEKMAYIWTDIYIKFYDNKNVRKCFLESKEIYYNWNRATIKQINTIFMRLIDIGYFQHAYELLETRKKLVDNIVMKELASKTFSENTNDCNFRNILCKRAGYIFDKYNNNNIFNHFQTANIYKDTNLSENLIYNVFDNKFESITCKSFTALIIKLQNDLKNK